MGISVVVVYDQCLLCCTSTAICTVYYVARYMYIHKLTALFTILYAVDGFTGCRARATETRTRKKSTAIKWRKKNILLAQQHTPLSIIGFQCMYRKTCWKWFFLFSHFDKHWKKTVESVESVMKCFRWDGQRQRRIQGSKWITFFEV